MSDEARRILELLASGKVTVDEADRLLKAVGSAPAAAAPEAAAGVGKPPARYLRVAVLKAAAEGRPDKEVNIRIPMSLVRGGMRLGAMVPGYGDAISERLRQRGVGVDFSKLDPAQVESLLREMGDLDIDVDNGRAKVRITCE